MSPRRGRLRLVSATAAPVLLESRSPYAVDGIVNLSRFGLTDPQHAWFTTRLEPFILGVRRPSFR